MFIFYVLGSLSITGNIRIYAATFDFYDQIQSYYNKYQFD